MKNLDEIRALLDRWCAYWKREDIFGPERDRMFDVQNEVAERVKNGAFRTTFTDTYVRGHGAGFVLGYEAALVASAEAMRDRCLRIAEQEKALAAAAGFVPWSCEEGYHTAAERIEQRIKALAIACANPETPR